MNVVSSQVSQLKIAAGSPAKHRSAEKKLPLDGRVFDVDGHTAFLILPKQQVQGKPTPWVWYAPTLPKHPDKTERWMFEQFVANGIAIAGVDVGESYGSPAGRERAA